jgi:hypothetical protein
LPIIGGSVARFEARSWEEVGRRIPTQNLYKPGVLSSIGEVHNRINVEYFESQSRFYAGKPLRRGTLRANSGSYAQPCSVLLVVLDSWGQGEHG